MASPLVRAINKYFVLLFLGALFAGTIVFPITYHVAVRPYLLRRWLDNRQFAEQLRDDCRKLLAATPIPPGNDVVAVDQNVYPESIRSLRPSYVLVSASNVHVELCGGHDHYGIDYFAPGVPVVGALVVDGLYRYRH